MRQDRYTTVNLWEARGFLADFRMLHPEYIHLYNNNNGEIIGYGSSIIEIIKDDYFTYTVVEEVTY